MTDNDFNRIRSILKGTFPKITFFDTPDTQNVLFNALNRYDFRDTWKGVLECVETSQFPPSIREITDYIERAEKNRHADERQNARQTWDEAVRCTRCNDAGFLFVTYRRPSQDPSHCWPDDHPKYPGPYDYTEAAIPCNCVTARDKFPWAFMTDEEWAKWVEDERRKGRNPSRQKPGITREEIEANGNELYNIRPGRRPQVFTRGKG